MSLTPDEEARIARLEQLVDGLAVDFSPLRGKLSEPLGTYAPLAIVSGRGALHLASYDTNPVSLGRNVRTDGEGNYYLLDTAEAGYLLRLDADFLTFEKYDPDTGPVNPSSTLSIGLPSSASWNPSDVPVGDTAVAASTVTQVAGPISLDPGRWLILGWVSLLMGGTAGVASAYIRQSTSRVSGEAVWSLAANTRGGGLAAALVVDPAVATSYNLAAFAGQAMSVRDDGLGGSSLATGIVAVRVRPW